MVIIYNFADTANIQRKENALAQIGLLFVFNEQSESITIMLQDYNSINPHIA